MPHDVNYKRLLFSTPPSHALRNLSISTSTKSRGKKQPQPRIAHSVLHIHLSRSSKLSSLSIYIGHPNFPITLPAVLSRIHFSQAFDLWYTSIYWTSGHAYTSVGHLDLHTYNSLVVRSHVHPSLSLGPKYTSLCRPVTHTYTSPHRSDLDTPLSVLLFRMHTPL
jgi:hypothetical protein